MKFHRLLAAMFIMTLTAGPGLADESQEVSVGLSSMSGLKHLCFLHDGQQAGMWSSHDESDGNLDNNKFHGKYKGQRLLARIDGPGVIYRIWSAKAMGKIYFYFDGEETPRIECKMDEFLQGNCLLPPELHVGRDANYFPIAFEESVIVTATNFPDIFKMPPLAYYQISYMQYDQNPGLKTFSASDTDPANPELVRAISYWHKDEPEQGSKPVLKPMTTAETLEIGPGQTKGVIVQGPGYIEQLKVVNPDDPMDSLEELKLRVYWDGSGEPAIDSPVDAFFGNKFDARRQSPNGPYRTLGFSATESGYYCHFPMPYGSMRLVIENTGQSSKTVAVEFTSQPVKALPANAMRFHALYNEQDYPDNLSRKNTEGLFTKVDQDTNYVVLDHQGQGYYVGQFLYVESLGQLWWGEGDEMTWVDGAQQALIRGTGTEDEFNWSWGFMENRSPVSGALLANPTRPLPWYSTLCLECMPEDYKTEIGYNTVYRYRQADYIPFDQTIKVEFERLGMSWYQRYPMAFINWTIDRGDDYASVAFWYEIE